MGYSYVGQSLCCDLCNAVGARKVRCPFGYCPATAACPNCRKTRKDALSKAAHRGYGCEANHAKYVAEEQARVALIASGALLSCAARHLNGDQSQVRVTFVSRDGYYEAVMPTAVYDARVANPLGHSTLAFYEGVHGAPIATIAVDSNGTKRAA